MFAREEQVVVRFIEFMPLEEDRVWTPHIVVTLDEVVRRMSEYLPLEEITHERSETARRYRSAMRGRDWDYCAGVASVLRPL